jgi:hypothetical protein
MPGTARSSILPIDPSSVPSLMPVMQHGQAHQCARARVLPEMVMEGGYAVVSTAAQEAAAAQFDSLISRPATFWIGRAFIGYSRAKMPICCGESCTGCFITIHSTPSLQGGVVSEPM